MTKISEYIECPTFSEFGAGLDYKKIDDIANEPIIITHVRFYKKFDESTGEEREKVFFSFYQKKDPEEHYTNTGSRAIVGKLMSVAQTMGITEPFDVKQTDECEWDLEVTVKQRTSKENRKKYWDIF